MISNMEIKIDIEGQLEILLKANFRNFDMLEGEAYRDVFTLNSKAGLHYTIR